MAWVQQKGRHVRMILQLPTTDAPPLGVQVEVAEWIVAHIAWERAEVRERAGWEQID